MLSLFINENIFMHVRKSNQGFQQWLMFDALACLIIKKKSLCSKINVFNARNGKDEMSLHC